MRIYSYSNLQTLEEDSMTYATQDIFDQCIASRMEEAQRKFDKQLAEVQTELKSVKENRDTILAEKRALQGKDFTAVGVQQNATSLLISRDIARNPADYQKYKAAAKEQNLQFGVIPDAKESRVDKPMPDFHSTRTHHIISRDFARNPQNFQREKALAAKNNLIFHVATTAEEFPSEAFKEPS